MTTPTGNDPMLPGSPEPTTAARLRASAAFLVGLVLLGFLLFSAAKQTRPGPRLARKAKLVDLIRLQDRRTSALRSDLEELRRRLTALEASAEGGKDRVAGIRAQSDLLAPFAGLAAIKGPGMRITLQDSTLRKSPTGDPNDLVIHEQDLQAVVNALWAGGAEGIAINGERITGTSAIRCVGNTLLLHGSVYSPPYRLAAIGDATRLQAALDADDGVERLEIVAERFKLGYEVVTEKSLMLPAFRGAGGLRHAQPDAAARTRRR